MLSSSSFLMPPPSWTHARTTSFTHLLPLTSSQVHSQTYRHTQPAGMEWRPSFSLGNYLGSSSLLKGNSVVRTGSERAHKNHPAQYSESCTRVASLLPSLHSVVLVPAGNVGNEKVNGLNVVCVSFWLRCSSGGVEVLLGCCKAEDLGLHE